VYRWAHSLINIGTGRSVSCVSLDHNASGQMDHYVGQHRGLNIKWCFFDKLYRALLSRWTIRLVNARAEHHSTIFEWCFFFHKLYRAFAFRPPVHGGSSRSFLRLMHVQID